MIGQVVEKGSAVSSVERGDFAVFTVRRGCGRCPACEIQRSDMCYSGDYADRGIKRRDGYQAEYVVDHERYLLKVPKAIAEMGVLAEPMSIAQKAIDEAVTIQRGRLPDVANDDRWLEGRRVLVAGLGPIGLVASIALRLRGANVLGLDIVDRTALRARLLEEIGGKYVDGRRASPQDLGEHHGRAALIFEATGITHLEFDLLSALERNGIYVLTGIPGGDRPIDIHGAPLVRGLVLGNQLMVGSVNASRAHFEKGISDLVVAQERWGEAVDRMITHRFPHTEFNAALTEHLLGEIKAVVEWAQPA